MTDQQRFLTAVHVWITCIKIKHDFWSQEAQMEILQ